jgi:hypothetical protein
MNADMSSSLGDEALRVGRLNSRFLMMGERPGGGQMSSDDRVSVARLSLVPIRRVR